MFRLYLLEFISAAYLILIGWVLGSVWRLNLPLARRIAILLATCVLAPAGFTWYLIEAWIEKKKKKEAKKKREREKQEKEQKEENVRV